MIHHSRGQPFGGAVRVLDLRLAILCAEGPRLSLLHPANAGESRKKSEKRGCQQRRPPRNGVYGRESR